MDNPAALGDKDAPLKEDIRLLGRLLGDVLRDQEGDAVFDVVETIRQTAVRFRRDDDPAAGVGLAAEAHGRLTDGFDHSEHFLALLVAQHVAQQAAEQADVFLQGGVFVTQYGWIVHCGVE